jgi:phosphate transport system substrate-binding protein
MHAGEAAACRSHGVSHLELPLALDGVSIVVNPANERLDCISVEELRRIWRRGSTVGTWRDLRPDLPAEPLRLYGPGTGSGTFDTFTETVTGAVGASRADFQASEDDNVLVQGVMGDPNALAYFGFGYLTGNRDGLKVLAVDGGEGCVLPSQETIRDGRYAPLSRRLYLYVSRASLLHPGVREFLDFLLANASSLVPPTGLVPLPDSIYAANARAVAGGPAGEPAGQPGPQTPGGGGGASGD